MIRDAEPARDAPACAAIYAPYVVSSPVSFEEQALDAVAFARRIEQVTASHPWLAAERDGHVVGFAYAAPHRERAAYRWATDVSVYVEGGAQRQGIGHALYEELFERLRAQRLRVACAGITLPNPASVALHESLGFELVGVYRNIGWKAGAWRDVGWWQLQLLPPVPDPPEPLPPQRG